MLFPCIICPFEIFMFPKTLFKVFCASGIVGAIGTFKDIHVTSHDVYLSIAAVPAPLNDRGSVAIPRGVAGANL